MTKKEFNDFYKLINDAYIAQKDPKIKQGILIALNLLWKFDIETTEKKKNEKDNKK